MNRIPFTIGARSIDVGYYNVKFTAGGENTQGPTSVRAFPSIAPVLRSGAARQMEGFAQPDGCVARINDVS